MKKEERNARLAKKIEELERTLKTLDRIRFAIDADDEDRCYADLRIIEAKEEIDDAIYDLKRALNRLAK